MKLTNPEFQALRRRHLVAHELVPAAVIAALSPPEVRVAIGPNRTVASPKHLVDEHVGRLSSIAAVSATHVLASEPLLLTESAPRIARIKVLLAACPRVEKHALLGLLCTPPGFESMPEHGDDVVRDREDISVALIDEFEPRADAYLAALSTGAALACWIAAMRLTEVYLLDGFFQKFNGKVAFPFDEAEHHAVPPERLKFVLDLPAAYNANARFLAFGAPAVRDLDQGRPQQQPAPPPPPQMSAS